MIKKCGDCFYWMKSNFCPKEKNVNGWNKGPNCNDIICSKFKDMCFENNETLEENKDDQNECYGEGSMRNS